MAIIYDPQQLKAWRLLPDIPCDCYWLRQLVATAFEFFSTENWLPRLMSDGHYLQSSIAEGVLLESHWILPLKPFGFFGGSKLLIIWPHQLVLISRHPLWLLLATFTCSQHKEHMLSLPTDGLRLSLLAHCHLCQLYASRMVGDLLRDVKDYFIVAFSYCIWWLHVRLWYQALLRLSKMATIQDMFYIYHLPIDRTPRLQAYDDHYYDIWHVKRHKKIVHDGCRVS